MSGDNSGYIVLSFIGGIMLTLMAGGMYYANSINTENVRVGWGSGNDILQAPNKQYGGRKTHRRKNHSRQTRKL
jgi:hypothetical protein